MTWGLLLICQAVVLLLPLAIAGFSDTASFARLTTQWAAEPGAYLLGFVLLGFPVLLTMWATLVMHRHADWLRGLWTATGALALAALAVCGTAQLLSLQQGTMALAWPLTTIVQSVALGMYAVMWWVFRAVARANHQR
jgi:hypothetical protein